MKDKTIIKFFVWLFFAFLIPFVMGGGLMFYYEKDARRAELLSALQRDTEAFAQCVAEPMAYYAPQEIMRAAQLIALHEYVVEVFAYSDVFDTPLVNIEIPERRKGELVQREKKVSFEGKDVGGIRIVASMEILSRQPMREFKWIMVIFLGMFVAGFLAVAVVFRRNVALPLDRLLGQARKISEGRMDEPEVWVGHNEFARLGRTIEGMRRKLFHQFQEMSLEARVDDLTGISNRRDFLEKVTNVMAVCSESEHPFSLIMFDLDNFKRVNDNHGHQVGDQVLHKTSSVVQGNVRAGDLFARWGGEEFLLALPGVSGHRACLLAEKLRQVIADVSYPQGLRMTASFGVAQAQKNEAFADLLERVDQAMYSAKRSGRNRVVRHEGDDGL